MASTNRRRSVAPRAWARAVQVYGRSILLYGTFFKLRGLLMLPLLGVMLLVTDWEWENDYAIWPIGLSLFAAGLALRIWSQRHLKYRLRLAEPELATDGPYRYVRNPVYIGNAALLVGLAILCELVWMIPITLVWVAIVYGLAVRFEEARLLRMFGAQYDAYRARVPGWLPTGVGIHPLALARGASLKRAFAVECHCLLFLLLPLAKEIYVDAFLG
jgi:protein-S-isoprenylcysteine O-methyltransferase Ste14